MRLDVSIGDAHMRQGALLGVGWSIELLTGRVPRFDACQMSTSCLSGWAHLQRHLPSSAPLQAEAHRHHMAICRMTADEDDAQGCERRVLGSHPLTADTPMGAPQARGPSLKLRASCHLGCIIMYLYKRQPF